MGAIHAYMKTKSKTIDELEQELSVLKEENKKLKCEYKKEVANVKNIMNYMEKNNPNGVYVYENVGEEYNNTFFVKGWNYIMQRAFFNLSADSLVTWGLIIGGENLIKRSRLEAQMAHNFKELEDLIKNPPPIDEINEGEEDFVLWCEEVIGHIDGFQFLLKDPYNTIKTAPCKIDNKIAMEMRQNYVYVRLSMNRENMEFKIVKVKEILNIPYEMQEAGKDGQ